jgi:branched-chain amino acid transport system ATP-binding protein
VLTVRDNILTAADIRRGWARDKSDPHAETQQALERTGLLDYAEERADRLPTGVARLLEVARALVTKPRILLLDEPAAGLNEQETRNLSALLTDLAADGLGVVLVEHDMDMVMQVCSLVTVLNLGQVLMTGTPEQVRTDPAVLSAYLGGAPVTAS